jgi:polyisoprenoid-binding protein YceI
LTVRNNRAAMLRPAKRGLVAFALLLLLPAAASASAWKVVAGKSWLGFKGEAGGSTFDGRFSRWDARIAFDPAQAEQGHATVSVDMASASTGDKEKDQALPQAAWFDASSFPKATLTVQSFRARGGNDYNAIGTLSLRSLSKPIDMPMTIAIDHDTLHATGHLDLVRTDYGVGASVGAQWVGLAVTAAFDVTAVRAP